MTLKTRLMNIEDKTDLNNENCCPPHWLPHRIPIIEPLVTDEPCHIHKAKWRMVHHKLYCQVLKCPHYEIMMQQYRNTNKSQTK
jgi:hypothetical protein